MEVLSDVTRAEMTARTKELNATRKKGNRVSALNADSEQGRQLLAAAASAPTATAASSTPWSSSPSSSSFSSSSAAAAAAGEEDGGRSTSMHTASTAAAAGTTPKRPLRAADLLKLHARRTGAGSSAHAVDASSVATDSAAPSHSLSDVGAVADADPGPGACADASDAVAHTGSTALHDVYLNLRGCDLGAEDVAAMADVWRRADGEFGTFAQLGLADNRLGPSGAVALADELRRERGAVNAVYLSKVREC